MRASRNVQIVHRPDGGRDFDEQLWPINAMLFIFACCVAAVIVTSGIQHDRFVNPWHDAKLAFNAWLHLGALGLVIVALLAGTASLRHRVTTRRMQLSVLMALLIQFMFFVGLYILPGPKSNVPFEDLLAANDGPPVTIPDYGPRSPDQSIVDPFAQPVENPLSADVTAQSDPTRSATASQPLNKSEASGNPSGSSQQQPTQSQISRAAVASTQPAVQSGGTVSRTQMPDRVLPTPEATAPSAAVATSSARPVDARPTPLARSQTSPAQLQRRDTQAPASQTNVTQPVAAIQSSRADATPQSTRASTSVARQSPTEQNTAQAEQPQPSAAAVASAQPSRDPAAQASRANSASSSALGGSSQSAADGPSSPSQVAMSQSGSATRATSNSQPATSSGSAGASQSMARLASDSAAAGQEPSAAANVAEARSTTGSTQLGAASASRPDTAAGGLSASGGASGSPATAAGGSYQAGLTAGGARAATGQAGPTIAGTPGQGGTLAQRTTGTQGAGTAAGMDDAPAAAGGTISAASGPGGTFAAAAAPGPSRASGIGGTLGSADPGGQPSGGSGPGTLTAGPMSRAGTGGTGQPAVSSGGGLLAGRTSQGSASQADGEMEAGGPSSVRAESSSGIAGGAASGSRGQTPGGTLGERSTVGGPAGRAGTGSGTDLNAAASLARAGGQGEPQVGAGQKGATIAARGRSGSGTNDSGETPDAVGPTANSSGPSGSGEPTARLAARAGSGAGTASGLTGRSGSMEGPDGSASVLQGAAGGPRRATEGSAGGPVVANSGAGTLQRSTGNNLPSGADLADEPGPAAGPAVASTSGGTPGPAAREASRRQENRLQVAVPADMGPGGLTNRPGELGLPSRAARADSPVVQTTPDRFQLDRARTSLSSGGTGSEIPDAFAARLERTRKPLGSPGTDTSAERAVEAGLDFLARHQSTDGRWKLHAFTEGKTYEGKPYRLPAAEARIPVDYEIPIHSDTAATGLALLAFYGAGYTHTAPATERQGKYRDKVSAALKFLLSQQKSNGDLYVRDPPDQHLSVWLYSHGIAAIALCEAYGMTKDPALKEPAQKALDFIVMAQSAEGGWRYAPKIGSDTSVSGWMVMALKSGQLAGLTVPGETFRGVERWLDYAHPRDNASRYIYRPQSTLEHQYTPSRTMTAEGLLMRLYLGWGVKHPDLDRGVEYLMEHLPNYRPGQRDSYYWYYATNLLIHVKDKRWETWNERLKKLLIDKQETQGPLRGSWDPLGESRDPWASMAGRIYVTAMHLLMLEVHYRSLPLYKEGLAGPEVASGKSR
jgi:hypothetical protein